MSTNCLVTKLKEVVSNDNLKEIGVMYITLSYKNAAMLDITSSVDQDIIASEGNFIVSYQKVKTLHLKANTKTTVYSDAQLKVKIPNKYVITYIHYKSSIPEFNIEDLEYSMGLTAIAGNTDSTNITGNIKYLKNKVSMTELVIPYSKVTGELSDIADLKHLTNLNISNTKISGDIRTLSSFIELTNIKIAGSNIYGTLESLVVGQVSGGRTSGSIAMGHLRFCPNVTFNGVNPNDSNATLTWEPNSAESTNTDVSYNGVTITINANGNKVE